MLKQQNNFDYLLNSIFLTIDTLKTIAINGFDDDYKSLEIVQLCNKLYIFVDNVRQCYSPDKSPDLNNFE